VLRAETIVSPAKIKAASWAGRRAFISFLFGGCVIFFCIYLLFHRVFILFFGGKEKCAKESRREKKLRFSRLVLLCDDGATALPG